MDYLSLEGTSGLWARRLLKTMRTGYTEELEFGNSEELPKSELFAPEACAALHAIVTRGEPAFFQYAAWKHASSPAYFEVKRGFTAVQAECSDSKESKLAMAGQPFTNNRNNATKKTPGQAERKGKAVKYRSD